ncbi:5'-nucleotidase C-terminal domain-containing protein [Membranihabitans maritimus]|uniref:5'-nucleotidase C-terminal domain-containing protein n=1 Tax=Membranihabitans maritimus TaxID=2904244 RepID=UPI001F030D93|nr:5'-nucleotidase C-terminal domain-containing protein [Membranihabitans maritimus]
MKLTNHSSIFLSIIFIVLILFSCQTTYHPVQAEFDRYRLNGENNTEGAPEIESLIAPYKSEVSSQMNEVIADIPQTLVKDRPESTLGNWMADAIGKYAEKTTGEKIDLSICNYGGVRIAELAKGELTVGNVYELMPFDNYVVTMVVEGKILIKILERIADYGGWPVSSELEMTIGGDHIIEAKLNSQSIDPVGQYRIALSDYLANGGDGLSFLSHLPKNNLNVYYRDALINIARSEKTITAKLEGRIKTNNHDQ